MSVHRLAGMSLRAGCRLVQPAEKELTTSWISKPKQRHRGILEMQQSIKASLTSNKACLSIYLINELIILKMLSFCVVCIIKTVVLLFKDGSNILHEILTCILLLILFRCCCISIFIVLTRWIWWLRQQQWPKIRFTFFCYCNTTTLVFT